MDRQEHASSPSETPGVDFVSRRGSFSAQRADADEYRFDRAFERLENFREQFSELRKINLVLVGLLTRSLRENRQERPGGAAATMEDARTSSASRWSASNSLRSRFAPSFRRSRAG